MRATLLASLTVSAVFAVGCAVDSTPDAPDPDAYDAEQDLTSSITLAAGATKDLHLNSVRGGDVAVTIDCHAPEDPDQVGATFKVSSQTLTLASSELANAGLWARSGAVPAGGATLTIQNLGAAASCTLKTTPVAASQQCKAWSARRSPNTDHNHLKVGTEAIQAGWEPFPASGNHWGAWAMWNTVYPKAIKRGYLLHNLEHGGLVLSYKCGAESESAACTDAKNKLVGLAQKLGTGRILITPDPTQPTMFAVRAWRTSYSSDCFDEKSSYDFAKAHFAHGREDIDANPPIPFDPTGTNVPCEDLMAAPDSCN